MVRSVFPSHACLLCEMFQLEIEDLSGALTSSISSKTLVDLLLRLLDGHKKKIVNDKDVREGTHNCSKRRAEDDKAL